MYKLTDEQIERLDSTVEAIANEIARESMVTKIEYKWIGCCSIRDIAEKHILAAVPHLQYPIAEPTGEELVVATMSDWNFASNHGSNIAECCRYALLQFVARRNAALLPKPDPRREKIRNALVNHAAHTCNQLRESSHFDSAADAILKALDEVGHE